MASTSCASWERPVLPSSVAVGVVGAAAVLAAAVLYYYSGRDEASDGASAELEEAAAKSSSKSSSQPANAVTEASLTPANTLQKSSSEPDSRPVTALFFRSVHKCGLSCRTPCPHNKPLRRADEELEEAKQTLDSLGKRYVVIDGGDGVTLAKELAAHNPRILHFIGHTNAHNPYYDSTRDDSPKFTLMLYRNDDGGPRQGQPFHMNPDDVADVLSANALDRLDLVVLNGCHSADLLQHILGARAKRTSTARPRMLAGCGWETIVDDLAAARFTPPFYDRLISSSALADDKAAQNDEAQRVAFAQALRDAWDWALCNISMEPGACTNYFKVGEDPADHYGIRDDGTLYNSGYMHDGPRSNPGRDATVMRPDRRRAAGVPVLLVPLSERMLHGVPALPEKYKSRPQQETALEGELVPHRREGAPIKGFFDRRLCIVGFLGHGKSTMAWWLAHSMHVQTEFPDGIYALRFDEQRGENGKAHAAEAQAAVMMAQLAKWLGGEDVGKYEKNGLEHDPLLDASADNIYNNVVKNLLEGKRILIILDNVWDTKQMRPFKQCASRTVALLQTTRDVKIAHSFTAPDKVHKLEGLDGDSMKELVLEAWGKTLLELEAVEKDALSKLLDKGDGSPAMAYILGRCCHDKRGAVAAVEYLNQHKSRTKRLEFHQAEDYSCLLDLLEAQLDLLAQRQHDAHRERLTPFSQRDSHRECADSCRRALPFGGSSFGSTSSTPDESSGLVELSTPLTQTGAIVATRPVPPLLVSSYSAGSSLSAASSWRPRTPGGSVDVRSSALEQQCIAHGIFPEKTRVPYEVLSWIWGVDVSDVDDTVLKLEENSLLMRGWDQEPPREAERGYTTVLGIQGYYYRLRANCSHELFYLLHWPTVHPKAALLAAFHEIYYSLSLGQLSDGELQTRWLHELKLGERSTLRSTVVQMLRMKLKECGEDELNQKDCLAAPISDNPHYVSDYDLARYFRYFVTPLAGLHAKMLEGWEKKVQEEVETAQKMRPEYRDYMSKVAKTIGMGGEGYLGGENGKSRFLHHLQGCGGHLAEGSLRSVETINLYQVPVDDVALSSLAFACAHKSLTNLQELVLYQNQGIKKALSAFFGYVDSTVLPNLKVLNIQRNQLDDETISDLAEAAGERGAFQSLTSLMLSENRVGSEGVNELAKVVGQKRALPHLTVLWLHTNAIEADGLVALAKAYVDGGFRQLEELLLYKNRIGPEGFLWLGPEGFLWPLPRDPDRSADGAIFAQLRELSLYNRDLDSDNNYVGNLGIESLASACQHGALAQLQRLWMRNNGVGNGGLRALGKAAEAGHLQHLEVLSLAQNQIGSPGVIAFASSCRVAGTLPALRRLDLSNNMIEASGMMALASCLTEEAETRGKLVGVQLQNAHRTSGASPPHGELVGLALTVNQPILALPAIDMIPLEDNGGGWLAPSLDKTPCTDFQLVADALKRRKYEAVRVRPR